MCLGIKVIIQSERYEQQPQRCKVHCKVLGMFSRKSAVVRAEVEPVAYITFNCAED